MHTQLQPRKTAVTRRAYSLAEVELASGLSRATLYRRIASGKLRTAQAGPKQKRLVPARELDNFLRPAGDEPT